MSVDVPAMIERRKRLLGSAYRLFYEEPVQIVRGEGVWLYDSSGKRYLDMYNNVPHVGHCHPHVVEALTRQNTGRTLQFSTSSKSPGENLITGALWCFRCFAGWNLNLRWLTVLGHVAADDTGGVGRVGASIVGVFGTREPLPPVQPPNALFRHPDEGASWVDIRVLQLLPGTAKSIQGRLRAAA